MGLPFQKENGFIIVLTHSSDEQSHPFYRGQGMCSAFFWISGCDIDMKVVLEPPAKLCSHGQTPNCHSGSVVAEEQGISGEAAPNSNESGRIRKSMQAP